MPETAPGTTARQTSDFVLQRWARRMFAAALVALASQVVVGCSGDLQIGGHRLIRSKVLTGEYHVAQKMKHKYKCPDAAVTKLAEPAYTYLAEGCGMAKFFGRRCTSHATGGIGYGVLGSRVRCVYSALGVAETQALHCEQCPTRCARTTTTECSAQGLEDCDEHAICMCECRLEHGGCGQSLGDLAKCMDLVRARGVPEAEEPLAPAPDSAHELDKGVGTEPTSPSRATP